MADSQKKKWKDGQKSIVQAIMGELTGPFSRCIYKDMQMRLVKLFCALKSAYLLHDRQWWLRSHLSILHFWQYRLAPSRLTVIEEEEIIEAEDNDDEPATAVRGCWVLSSSSMVSVAGAVGDDEWRLSVVWSSSIIEVELWGWPLDAEWLLCKSWTYSLSWYPCSMSISISLFFAICNKKFIRPIACLFFWITCIDSVPRRSTGCFIKTPYCQKEKGFKKDHVKRT